MIIRESRDHCLFDSYPRHIAAFHALHRLLSPRHPPHTLIRLATMMDDSRSCRETSDRGLVARYGQQPLQLLSRNTCRLHFRQVVKELVAHEADKITQGDSRHSPHRPSISKDVAGTRVLRRGDDIRETLGVQACGPNLDDARNPAEKLAAKPAKSYSTPKE